MTGLIAVRGLPGSGKTTLALGWVVEDPDRRALVCRDELRSMFHGGRLGTRAQEEQVSVAQDRMIRSMLLAGTDVMVHDTNLDPGHVAGLQELAFSAGADFGVVDLTDVPLQVCIDRDALRAARGERHVGEDVIRGMWEKWVKGQQYPLPRPAPAVYERYVAPSFVAPRVVLADVDGTVALRGDRSPYDESKVLEDLPNHPVLRAVRKEAEAGAKVIFMSGRSEKCRDDTGEWLATYYGYSWEKLLMRPVGDVRRDAVIKMELFDRHVRGKYRVSLVFDDRNQVVSMWRRIGLTVFQVADGDF